MMTREQCLKYATEQAEFCIKYGIALHDSYQEVIEEYSKDLFETIRNDGQSFLMNIEARAVFHTRCVEMMKNDPKFLSSL